MAWIKNVIIDLLVTTVVVIYVLTGAAWGFWVVAIYTPLMLLLKIGAVISGAQNVVKQKKSKAATEAPNWFFHVLYAVNFAFLLYAEEWILGIGWAGIWILSAIQASRARTSVDRS